MSSTNLFDALPLRLRNPEMTWSVINWLLMHHLTYRDRRKLLTHWAKVYNVQLTSAHFRRLRNDGYTSPTE